MADTPQNSTEKNTVGKTENAEKNTVRQAADEKNTVRSADGAGQKKPQEGKSVGEEGRQPSIGAEENAAPVGEEQDEELKKLNDFLPKNKKKKEAKDANYGQGTDLCEMLFLGALQVTDNALKKVEQKVLDWQKKRDVDPNIPRSNEVGLVEGQKSFKAFAKTLGTGLDQQAEMDKEAEKNGTLDTSPEAGQQRAIQDAQRKALKISKENGDQDRQGLQGFKNFRNTLDGQMKIAVNEGKVSKEAALGMMSRVDAKLNASDKEMQKAGNMAYHAGRNNHKASKGNQKQSNAAWRANDIADDLKQTGQYNDSAPKNPPKDKTAEKPAKGKSAANKDKDTANSDFQPAVNLKNTNLSLAKDARNVANMSKQEQVKQANRGQPTPMHLQQQQKQGGNQA